MATRKTTGKTKTTAKTAPATTLDDVLAAVAALREDVTSLVEAVSAEPEDEDDDEEEGEEEVEVPSREDVEAMGIKDLRALAKDLGIDATKKADILEALEEFLDDEEEDEEDDEEDEADEDEDEDEDEEEEEDEEDLEEMTLAELRKHAKSVGFKPSDYKGMDKDAIIEMIEGGDEDDDEEDEEEEDEEVLDEDALKAMTHKELIGLCKELDIKPPAALKKSSTANQKKLVKLILDSGEDE